MELGGLGGGIMVALAAGLWLVYLMPTWFRRREYLSTERNAIRLQQTLRVLAETAETPRAVTAESSARKAVAEQMTLNEERVALAIERSKAAQEARAVSRQLSPAQLAAAATKAQSRRVRRTRAVLSLVLVVSIVAAIAQLVLFGVTGTSMGGWAVLGFAIVGGVVALAGQARMTAVQRRRAVPVASSPRVSSPVVDFAEGSTPQQTQIVRNAEWTPVPVPKPLYLSQSGSLSASERAAASRMTSPKIHVGDPVAELKAAAAEAEAALRAAQASPEVSRIETAPSVTAAAAAVASDAVRAEEAPVRAAAAAPSRWASMGILDAADVSSTDLDDVLRRRRQAS